MAELSKKGKVGGESSLESQKRKGKAGRPTGQGVCIVASVICRIRCGAIAGHWSRAAEPQLCSLVPSVALSHLRSTFPIDKIKKIVLIYPFMQLRDAQQKGGKYCYS